MSYSTDPTNEDVNFFGSPMRIFLSSIQTDLPAAYRLSRGRHCTGWPQISKLETTSGSQSSMKPGATAVRRPSDLALRDLSLALGATYGSLLERRRLMDQLMLTDSGDWPVRSRRLNGPFATEL